LLFAARARGGYCGRVVGTPGVTAQCGREPDGWLPARTR